MSRLTESLAKQRKAQAVLAETIKEKLGLLGYEL